jgi:hypothetical protein
VIWTGTSRAECLDYYGAELKGCDNDCADANDQCVQSCEQYGDPACAAQCNSNAQYCQDSCAEDYDQRAQTCPAFLKKN